MNNNINDDNTNPFNYIVKEAKNIRNTKELEKAYANNEISYEEYKSRKDIMNSNKTIDHNSPFTDAYIIDDEFDDGL